MDNTQHSIWIVAGSKEQQQLCSNSLSDKDVKCFPDWEALLAKVDASPVKEHPRFCFLYDFDPEQTRKGLCELRGLLKQESEIVLFGPASDLKSMRQFFDENLIIDYLGIPLKSARIVARFERAGLQTA